MARRRDDDEEDDDRDDDVDVGKKQLSGLDGLFANTNIVLLLVFACCCNGIAAILGLVGVLVCTDPTAKKNATITLVVGGVITVLGIIGQIIGLLSR